MRFKILFLMLLSMVTLSSYSEQINKENIQQGQEEAEAKKAIAQQEQKKKTQEATSEMMEIAEQWRPGMKHAMPAKYDWVQMTSGEWLKGELTFIYRDDVEFDSDEFGIQTLDMDDIAQLKTAKVKSIQVKFDKQVKYSKVYIANNELTLVDYDNKVIPKDMLVSLSKNLSLAFSSWEGDVGLGVIIRSGNSSQKDYSTDIELSLRHASYVFRNTYSSFYSKSSGETTDNQHVLTSQLSMYIDRKTYWRPLGFEYFRDPFQNISARYIYNLGYGWFVIDEGRHDFLTYVGAGYQLTNFEDVESGQDDNADTFVFLLSYEYEYELHKEVDFFNDYELRIVNEESGHYISRMETGLKIDITSDIDLDITYILDHIEEPQPEEDGTIPDSTDTRLVLSLSYEF